MVEAAPLGSPGLQYSTSVPTGKRMKRVPPTCFSAQGALVVHPPRVQVSVLGEGHRVHAAARYLQHLHR